MALVEEETRRYRPTKNYLEFLPPPKTTFEVDRGDLNLKYVMWISVSPFEKWVWTIGISTANGNAQHEEVGIAMSKSLVGCRLSPVSQRVGID